MYEEFIDGLRREISKGLPGWEAQKRMAPYGRSQVHYNPEVNIPRESGVLIWLYPNKNKIYTRLILRAEGGVHSGQVAFPGGQAEQDDNGFWNTALREAEEEVGLSPDKITLVGALSPLYIPPSNFLVYPFVGAGENQVSGVVNKAEVQAYFDVDIMQLLQSDAKEDTVIIRSSGEKIETPSYLLEKHTVWGATAMILSELEELIKRTLSTKI